MKFTPVIVVALAAAAQVYALSHEREKRHVQIDMNATSLWNSTNATNSTLQDASNSTGPSNPVTASSASASVTSIMTCIILLTATVLMLA
ncbi:hypothetical protein V1512DRAFT_258700 [Lipomyces arxii]|uniref:uncharacterized protein n=1 Tax=Lipomyces arxii TaxID=56418 RepID=UPI0034CD9297